MPSLNQGVQMAIAIGLLNLITAPLDAQIETRRGVMLYDQARGLEQQQSYRITSSGVLADLETDPNFVGDFQTIYDAAATILDGYTPVTRGGYFPENAGIPREQQLTQSEAVYRVFSLNDGNELILYRSPLTNTSEYFIRIPDTAEPTP